MPVIGMRRKPKGLGVLDGPRDDLCQAGGSDRDQAPGLLQPSDQFLEIPGAAARQNAFFTPRQ